MGSYESSRFIFMLNRSIRLIGILFFSLLLASGAFDRSALAQKRTFLDLELEFLGEYELTQDKFQDTKIGGLSGITYDRNRELFYVISDDRSSYSPARFYTFKININDEKIEDINIKKVTLLKNEERQKYPANSIDPEAISYSPTNTLFISSE